MKKFTTEEILAKALQGTGDDPVQLQDYLANEVNTNPNFRIIRANNTLFFYINQGQGNVFIMTETADTPRDLVDAIKQFVHAMKIAGFKTGSFKIDNPQMIRVYKMAGIDVHVNQNNVGTLDF
jgi:hypothetical protein